MSKKAYSYQDYYWEHPAQHRYYAVHLHKDLLGYWILTQAWGSTVSRRGGVKHRVCQDWHEGMQLIETIGKRRSQRGYRLGNQTEPEENEVSLCP